MDYRYDFSSIMVLKEGDLSLAKFIEIMAQDDKMLYYISRIGLKLTMTNCRALTFDELLKCISVAIDQNDGCFFIMNKIILEE